MIPKYIDKSLIPHKPGIYIFKDKQSGVLYVGKAIDLYNRVASYFSTSTLPPKTASLVENISDLETIIVESELEALILEANLIKKFLPPYNIRLTDDKDYLYIVVTSQDFPTVETARKKDLREVKKYFGPFPSAKTVRVTLKRLRRVFPWCSNPPGPKNKSDRACFYYHLKLCPGACVGSIDKRNYQKIIRQLVKFLEGKKDELISELQNQMDNFSKRLEFEQAAKVKQEISGIEYLTSPNRVSDYLENPNFLEDENIRSLNQLQQDLKLSQLPIRIEAYDISNIQGKQATGSLVVLTNGEIDKSQYRRFKINPPAGGSGRPNDVGMHKEMMRRRLAHPEWDLPQLIVVDGGRGQARAVSQCISEASKTVKNIIDSTDRTNLSAIPIYGLAKRMEWLYPPEGEIIKLPKRSLSLRLLQKIRDESHRFAINYHRKLRQRSFLTK
ncbi:excinuclease ABC subunit UvrC [Candidatus Daviesbacteria bacterium]|nr:excinuclease ABC subunit UvrC [Candidatus Daviesbacteria bacterium]